MYLETFEPARPAAARPMPQRRGPFGIFVFVVQDSSIRFIAEACIDVLRSANRLTGRDGYRWKIIDAEQNLDQIKSGTNSPDQTLVLIGGTHTPWQPVPAHLDILKNSIRSAARLCVVGAAVFVPLAASVLSAKRMVVHPNFRAGVVENTHCPDITEGSTCHHNALSSATGHVAAIRMMVDLVGARDGEFTRMALARDLGLANVAHENRSVEQWRLHRMAEGNDVICEALQIMGEHLEDTLNVSQIAELLNVSPRKLERGFNDLLGQTPLKIYRDLRLERAHTLLSQTTLSVGEISVACGFSNVTLMKKWFHLKYGEEPNAVRRQAFAGPFAAT